MYLKQTDTPSLPSRSFWDWRSAQKHLNTSAQCRMVSAGRELTKAVGSTLEATGAAPGSSSPCRVCQANIVRTDDTEGEGRGFEGRRQAREWWGVCNGCTSLRVRTYKSHLFFWIVQHFYITVVFQLMFLLYILLNIYIVSSFLLSWAKLNETSLKLHLYTHL